MFGNIWRDSLTWWRSLDGTEIHQWKCVKCHQIYEYCRKATKALSFARNYSSSISSHRPHSKHRPEHEPVEPHLHIFSGRKGNGFSIHVSWTDSAQRMHKNHFLFHFCQTHSSALSRARHATRSFFPLSGVSRAKWARLLVSCEL